MEIDMHLGRRTVLTLASGLTGLALSAVIAGPASAAPPSTSPPPALAAWLASPAETTTAAPAAAKALGVNSALAKPAALVGKRDTFTRGGALAWSSDTFEWYWSGGSMSSSTAWQGDGYVFPNTVTLLGVKRTLAVAGQHNWRGTASIGAGVVTPWGSVDVYSQTITDYFVLYPGGGITHSNS
jgi:lipoprotein-anchoring transpeptidase ErfK/SrfK